MRLPAEQRDEVEATPGQTMHAAADEAAGPPNAASSGRAGADGIPGGDRA